MIRSLRVVGASLVALALALSPAQASFTFLNASSSTVTQFSFDSGTTPAGSGNCASNECAGDVPMDKTGTPLFTSTNPGFTSLNATPTIANGNGVVPTQGGSALSATNGGYSNLLQGNAVISATNGLYSNLLQGNAVIASGNPLFAQLTTGSAVIGALTANQSVNTAQVNGVTALTGAGATGTGSQRETVAQDTTTIAGSAPGTAGTASTQVITVQGAASMTPLLANPGTIATWGLAPIAAGSAPTNMQVEGLIYNSGGVTPSNGQSVALQGDANGYLEVNIKAGAGSGGTAAADNAAWTAGTTNQTPMGCEYTSGGATALTTGHVGTPGCTSARGLFTDLESVGGTAFGAAMSNLGTLASGTPATLNVNNYMVGCASTVCNTNGSAVSASSSPVVIASDQAAVATKAASAAFVAGSIADLAHGQGTMSASVPVTLASNQSVGDPCTFQAKINVPISTASGTLALVTGVSGKKVYVCSLSIVAPLAVAVSLAEGSSSSCGTSNQAGVIGVATSGTAANGLSFAANGGLTLGNGGGTVAQTATAADYLCLFQSGTVQMAGNLTYVQQ